MKTQNIVGCGDYFVAVMRYFSALPGLNEKSVLPCCLEIEKDKQGDVCMDCF